MASMTRVWKDLNVSWEGGRGDIDYFMLHLTACVYYSGFYTKKNREPLMSLIKGSDMVIFYLFDLVMIPI